MFYSDLDILTPFFIHKLVYLKPRLISLKKAHDHSGRVQEIEEIMGIRGYIAPHALLLSNETQLHLPDTNT